MIKSLILALLLSSAAVQAQHIDTDFAELEEWMSSTIQESSSRELTQKDVDEFLAHSEKISAFIALMSTALEQYKASIIGQSATMEMQIFKKNIEFLEELFRPFRKMGVNINEQFPEFTEVASQYRDLELRRADNSLARSYNELALSGARSEVNLEQAVKLIETGFLDNRVRIKIRDIMKGAKSPVYPTLEDVLGALLIYDLPAKEREEVKGYLASIQYAHDRMDPKAKTLSYYTSNSQSLNIEDFDVLLGKDVLAGFIRKATQKELLQIRQLIADMENHELSNEQFLELSYCLNRLDEKESSEKYDLKGMDAKSVLIAYAGLPTDMQLPNDFIVRSAMLTLIYDVELNHGRFSPLSLATFARDSVLIFIAANAPYPEIAAFAKTFKTVMEVKDLKYRYDYYRKPEFDQLKQELREIKGIIRK